MKVPLLDLQAQMEPLKGEILSAIEEVVTSCRFIGGPKVEALQAEIADYSGTEHGIGVSSGTDALLVALMALDVGPGDVVVTTPYSFFATAGAISRLGATPAFVDINPTSYNMDPEALRAYAAAHGSDRVKAVIPVHLYGQCADMDEILQIAGEMEAAVIEDAAQAIGAAYRQSDGVVKSAGSMGHVGCFSFFPSKNLGGLGDGGMVVTSDDDLAARIDKLRNHGGFPKYYHELIGGNFRLDALQAAAISVKLSHLDSWHRARQRNASVYDDLLSDVADITTPSVSQSREYHIYNQYVIRGPRRDALRQHLADNGIGTEIYYPVPFHLQACFEGLGYQPGDFPYAEAAANESLALPIYPELTEEMQAYVADQVRGFYA